MPRRTLASTALALSALLMSAGACRPVDITDPSGPVASFTVQVPGIETVYHTGDTLDLRDFIVEAKDAYGRPVPVFSLHPHWITTHVIRGAAVTEGDGLAVPVPEPGPDGYVWVWLWVAGDVPDDGTAEAGFGIRVAP